MTLATLISSVVCSFLMSFGSTDGCEKYLRVRKVQTPISQEELHVVLREAHVNVLGHEPNDNRVAMAWAQVAFENGRGKKVFNHNLGNTGAHPTAPKNAFYKVSGSRFRAHPNFQEGAEHYWETILKMCSGVLPAFDAGDPITASIILRRCGYYRAPVEHYSVSLSSLFFEQQLKRK